MSSVAARPLTVAVIGNPNTCKSTLFTALTGVHAQIGNYPGVTVEKKIGRLQHNGVQIQLVDLPGTYSLSPRSLDELVSVNVLLGRQADIGAIDAVVCIADASNLERNLYVVSQVLDLGLPTVLVLNMWDVAESRGLKIDAAELGRRLGIPVIPCEAHRQRHLAEVKAAIIGAASGPPPATPRIFPEVFTVAVQDLQQRLQDWGAGAIPRPLAERLLLDLGGQIETGYRQSLTTEFGTVLDGLRLRLRDQGFRIPAGEAKARYAWAKEILTGVLTTPTQRMVTASDRIDRVLTSRVGGLIVFCVVMFLVFQAISTLAGPLMDGTEAVFGFAGDAVRSVLPAGPLRSLIVDGAIAGVGGVLVFLPQICLLFLFIAILEDCGYMARAAFLMDRLMTRIGLSGKSFVPLMSSFACAIPGIMATRTIENRRDRLVTILIAPLMSCSARLPVYLLLIAVLIPPISFVGGWIHLQGLVLFAAMSLGALVAIPVAWLLRMTILKGETPPFVMELPAYKWPSPRMVLARVYDRGRAFVARAGTLIFATNILVWAASYFPGDHTLEEQLAAQVAELEESSDSFFKSGLKLIASQKEIKQKLNQIDPAALEAEALREQFDEIDVELTAIKNQRESYSASIEQKNLERNAEAERLLERSALGRLGRAIEPAVIPLGWDWKIGVGVLASFPAREVIIATLGTIYSLGGDIGEDDPGLQQAIRTAAWPDGRPVFTIPVGLSVMVFFALCAQCASTLMIIRRETNSWAWPAFTFVYMTVLAYLGALLTYQVGTWWMG
ncbi:MAG TPA: ferrous iron transport protein B [Planctomycetaceae bacterium]|nr:ferrous iron transport protein B [Planctomycetaceae bacterium]